MTTALNDLNAIRCRETQNDVKSRSDTDSQQEPHGAPMVQKLFVTGCPRSGTTLLQSILSHATSLHTLKETHFFKHTMRRRPLRWIDRHWKLDPARVREGFGFIARHNNLDMPTNIEQIQRLDEACAHFDAMLSQAATHQQCSGWLEKTPEHMFFLSDIRQHIIDARFVHILRDGPDVVASLIDARNKYPEAWGWIGSLSSAIRLYNRYARSLRGEIGRHDSFIIRYDDIIAQDRDVMSALEAFLGLGDGAIDLANTQTLRPDVVRSDEPWKIRSDQGIVDTKRQKFDKLFNADEQKLIAQNIIQTGDIISG